MIGLALLALLAQEPAPLALIHIEANVGGASGGHSALRIGDHVYHFQQTDSGLLRLVRDDWSGFRHVYAGLQNRTLHLAYVDAAAEDVERIARRFSLAYVEEELAFDRARRRRDDLAWLAALSGDGVVALRDGAPMPPLRAAGLLEPASEGATPGGDALRDEVAAAFGSGFLSAEIARLDRELAAFRLAPGATDLEPLRESLSLREALRAIVEDWPLARAAAIGEDDEFPGDVGFLGTLSDAERCAIDRFRDAQSQAILGLLRSGRPDRGAALHVAVARHRALSSSLERGRWIVLDPFPDSARRFPVENDSEQAAQGQLVERATALACTVRDALVAADRFDESRFNALEEVLARRREARRGAAGEPVRVHVGRMVPSRGRSVAWRLDADETAFEEKAAIARTLVDETERRLADQHAYSLVDRNCVTELVRLLDSAFPDAAATKAALGDHLEPGDDLAFIPWVFHDQAVARLRIEREEVCLSHRHETLARLEAEDAGVFATMREATTLTSTIYVPRSRDGDFLFFTDDVLWQRPLRGVANLGWGLGHGLFGVLAAPFDGGRRFRAGFHGAFFSLPELVFGNVRKGSFDVVPEAERASR